MKKLKYQQYDHKEKTWGDFIHEGTFLHWGIDSVESTVGSYTVAIVMRPDGTCLSLCPNLIKFDLIEQSDFAKCNESQIVFDSVLVDGQLIVMPDSIHIYGYVNLDSLNDFLYKTDEMTMDELKLSMKENFQYTIAVKYSTDSDDFKEWDVYEIIRIEESFFTAEDVNKLQDEFINLGIKEE